MNQHKFFNSALKVTILVAGFTATAVQASANLPWLDQPMTSIADSYHNLGAGNTRPSSPNGTNANPNSPNKSDATGEICVFCHTPHGGDNNAAVPIWNRILGDENRFTRYSNLGTSTFDATEAQVGSVTIACLSCHDGTFALDSVINAPGSGQYDFANGVDMGNMTGSDIGAGDQLATGIVQNLTSDLSDDHPVSMQYAGGNLTAAVDAETKDIDFTQRPGIGQSHPKGYQVLKEAAPAGATITQLWWIERGGDSLNNGVRDREDVILYSRANTTAGADEQPFVECGSCHDPHNIKNPTFLRVSNGIAAGSGAASEFPTSVGAAASGLCLTCHIK